MSVSVLVEIGNGDNRLDDETNELINSFDMAVKYGKKKIYDTRTKKAISFNSKYKYVTPNDLIEINDNIIGHKKCLVVEHNIQISNGVITSNLTVESDYE